MSSGREEKGIIFLTNIPVEASRRHTSVWEQGSNSHHYPWILLVQLDSWYKQGYIREKQVKGDNCYKCFADVGLFVIEE